VVCQFVDLLDLLFACGDVDPNRSVRLGLNMNQKRQSPFSQPDRQPGRPA
jgi:hypothetical protein